MTHPGQPWTSTYWDALDDFYWSLRYVGMTGIPKTDLTWEEGRVSLPASYLSEGRGLFVRSRKPAEVRAELHRDEVSLNQILATTLAIAADAVLGRLLARPLGLSEEGPFERIGDEVRDRYGWGFSENVTQQDGFYVSPHAAIALEIKLDAKTSAEQVLKYAALHAWEEAHGGAGKEIGLLYVVPERHVAGHWARAGLSGPDGMAGLVDLAGDMPRLPKRVRALVAEEPERLRSVLGRLRLAVISWAEFHAELGAIRASLGTGAGDETLDRLLAGLAAQIEAHEGTGVGDGTPKARAVPTSEQSRGGPDMTSNAEEFDQVIEDEPMGTAAPSPKPAKLSASDTAAILAFSKQLREHLKTVEMRHALEHTQSKNPAGPYIYFDGCDKSYWRLWWDVRRSWMVMDLGHNKAKGDDYTGLAEQIAHPDGIHFDKRGETHPATDYLIVKDLPTVDLTLPFEDQPEAVSAAVDAALSLVDLVPELLKARETQKAGKTSPLVTN